MTSQNVAPVLTPPTVSAMGAEPTKKRVRPYKARVATKVKWALGDIMEASLDAQRRMGNMLGVMDEARALAEISGNTALLALLGRFSHEMGYLQHDVSKMVQGATAAIAESKPEVEEKKKYSEL